MFRTFLSEDICLFLTRINYFSLTRKPRLMAGQFLAVEPRAVWSKRPYQLKAVSYAINISFAPVPFVVIRASTPVTLANNTSVSVAVSLW